jgi:dolichyl-phosphate beta-glucosyltransferase
MPDGVQPQLDSPFLSIIIPAYNEESRLPQTLAQVLDFIQGQPFESEVLVVENGSQDHTLRIAQEFAASHGRFQAFHEAERGKGLAVKRGMLQAVGKYRFMCDVDLSMPVAEIPRFLPPRLVDFDVAIASREAPGAVRYNETAYRHLGGRLINWMIRLLALPGLQDTQCGFKCLRDVVAEDLFDSLSLTGWSFDVEMLYLARAKGYRIVELPIPWYFNADSRIHPLKDSLKIVLDILQMRRNARRGFYRNSPADGAGRQTGRS